jgi:hypothetical protein
MRRIALALIVGFFFGFGVAATAAEKSIDQLADEIHRLRVERFEELHATDQMCLEGTVRHMVGFASDKATAVRQYCVGQNALQSTLMDVTNIPGFEQCQVIISHSYYILKCDGKTQGLGSADKTQNCRYFGIHRDNINLTGWNRKARWDVVARTAEACGETPVTVQQYKDWRDRLSSDNDLRYKK